MNRSAVAAIYWDYFDGDGGGVMLHGAAKGVQNLFTRPTGEDGIVYDSLNTGTVRDPLQGSSIIHDGVNGVTIFGNVGTIEYISMRVTQAVDNQMLFSLANTAVTGVSVVAGVLTFGASITAGTIYVDNVAVSAAAAGVLLNDNLDHHLLVKVTSIAASNFELGYDGVTYGNATFHDVRVGNSDISVANIGEAFWGRTTTDETGWWPSQERINTKHLDISGSDVLGTASGGVTFARQDIKCYSTDNGYTISDGATYYSDSAATILIPSGTYIPNLASDITKSVAYISSTVRATADFTGKAPINGQSVNAAHGIFNGISDTIAYGNVGSVTSLSIWIRMVTDNDYILSLDNTTAKEVHVVAGVLTFGASLTDSNITIDTVSKTPTEAGALLNDNTWHLLAFDLVSVTATALTLGSSVANFGNFEAASLELNGGALFDAPLAEGAGGTSFDVSGNGNNGDITATLSAFWALTNQSYFYNVANGFDWAGFYDGAEYFELTTANYLASSSSGYVEVEFFYTDPGGYLFSSADEATNDFFLLFAVVSAKVEITYKIGGAFTEINSTTSLVSGNFYKLRFESTGTAYKIFINDVEETIVVVTGTDDGTWFSDIPTQRDNIAIGVLHRITYTNHLIGYIHSVKVYDVTTLVNHWNYKGEDQVGSLDMVNTGVTFARLPVARSGKALSNPSGPWWNNPESVTETNPLGTPSPIRHVDRDETSTLDYAGIVWNEFINNEDIARVSDYRAYTLELTTTEAEEVFASINKWDPSQMTLAMWLEAYYGKVTEGGDITIVTGISNWADRSQGADDVTQGTASFQSAYNDTAVKSERKATPDSVDNRLDAAAFFAAVSSDIAGEFWAVTEKVGANNAVPISFGDSAGTAKLQFYINQADGNIHLEYDANTVVFTNTNTGKQVIRIGSDGSNYFCWSNGDSLSIFSGTDNGNWIGDNVSLDNCKIGMLDGSSDTFYTFDDYSKGYKSGALMTTEEGRKLDHFQNMEYRCFIV